MHRRRRIPSRRALALGLVALLACALPARAEEPPPAQPGDTITWVDGLERAFELAAKQDKPVMICINSRRVDGGRKEPAAEWLREIIYKDPRVVTRSRAFVCVFLTSAGSSGDYGELRARLGIEGLIVSPQHIFAHPDQTRDRPPLFRKEYWPYGKDEQGVQALLDMMATALEAHAARPEATEPSPDGPDGGGATPPPEEAPAVPEGAEDAGEARTAWIRKLLDLVKDGTPAQREEAVRSLVASDQEGDCIDPLLELMVALEDDDRFDAATTVVRGLGVPGLTKAAEAMHDFLKHDDDALRANTAVTLEYIGSEESVRPLKSALRRERDEAIANHMYRALGRCGAGDGRVRAFLAKQAKGSKSEDAAFGPIVGLAYFEKDVRAARTVEKMLQALGTPGGRRGGGRGTRRRALLAWTLSEIGDEKSGLFMRERMIAPLEHTQAWWKEAVVTYYDAVARTCEGAEGAAGDVDQGIRRTLEFTGGTDAFHTDARKGRDVSRFQPKGEWEVEGRDFGGGGGGRGGRGGR